MLHVAPTLLLNMLEASHQGRRRQRPFFPFHVARHEDHVDAYVTVFLAEGAHPVPADVIKSLCYRYNPDVTYQTYLDTISTELTVDAILKANGY